VTGTARAKMCGMSTAAPSSAPVSAGSSNARTLDGGAFRVTYARFPPGGRIPPHHHDRACIAVMLDGSFDLQFPGRPACACEPGSLTVEPIGDTHCNCMGALGAEVLVVQPDPGARELLAPVAHFLDGIRQVRHPDFAGLAHRMAAELQRSDSVTPMALEGMALELLVLASRAGMAPRPRPAPVWLVRVEELLRARYAELLSLQEVAREAGVHPAHLARVFRQHHHCSLGGFVRRLRVSAAAARLAGTDLSIAQVAVEVGFSDQSHLTRRFREQMGTTPERWRRTRRG
jgi:AraC family transcriptional regulator